MMKKIVKSLISLITVVCVLLSVCTLTASAASVTVSGGEYNIGQSVKVPIKFNADATLYAVEITATYNANVLRFEGASGADYSGSGGTVKIVDDNFSASKPSKTSSYTLNFTAIAEGTSTVAVSVLGAGEATSSASASAAISVVKPKPSSNANLSTLKLSAGSLSPAFSAKTTSYTAKVKYSDESITISAGVADGGATLVGAGSFKLQVGENTRTVTVTAADGTKKSYTLKITRMTEEETAAAEQAERDANPLLVVINGADFNIVTDITNITVPADFTASTALRKETEIPVFTDNFGKYTLCYLTDTAGENGDFYIRDENDNFTRLIYINSNGRFYIAEPLEEDVIMPTGYIETELELNGGKVKAFKRDIPELSDFYLLKCYVGGESAYYRYDALEGTVQRAADFDLALETASQQVAEPQSIVEKFLAMNTIGKIVVSTFAVTVVIILVVIILLIVKAAKGKREVEIEENDFDDFIDS